MIGNIYSATDLSSSLPNTDKTISSVYKITTRGNLDGPVDVNGTGYEGKYPLKTTEAELLRACVC